MIVWSLRDWEEQGLNRSEVEVLLKSKGYIVSGWCNSTPRLANGTLLDAQRVIEGSRIGTPEERPVERKPRKRRR